MFMTTRRRIALVLCGLLIASTCSAANAAKKAAAPAPYTEGDQYVTLPAPYQRHSSTGKVEVVEVFSYGCIHCAEFSPLANQLAESLPPGAVFKLVPAVFNEGWVTFARAFYAAKIMGVAERTHLAFFQAKFQEHYPISTMDEIADFYARNGVDRNQFLRIANSPQVTNQIKSDFELIKKWGVDSTPTIVVDGKYRSNNVTSFQQLADLAKWLAQRELDEKSSGRH
ncbi:thiol:disulfide interchange protein DsbA/DsbL [Rhodanobacter sp. C05]|uniref:thiol:disulfide interchange protein DsbA/DsbL n=1 Tax=Rhodanobacter sp. C05 TaxID=1945855 RepID=UPI0009847492|nr:thiol:disulfide interchange protein DsbA/DsbL [Rhodanobacter sp. C05]OOG39154.1 disulfide bond formation protein DsbA [Rhodanobacter sp. C05]